MNKVFKVVLAVMFAATMMSLQGCSEPVPPGYLGKVITPKGIKPETYETGRASVWWRERLILIQTASVLRPAPVHVIMDDHYKDNNGEHNRIGLAMDFTINIRYRLNTNKNVINSMMKDMKLGKGVNRVDTSFIYNKYGKMVVSRVSREILGKYTPEEVLQNLPKINKSLFKGIKSGLDNSPLIVSSVSLGPISLPEVITDRINKNKKTELSIVSKQAQQKIDMLKKRNEVELAKQQAVKDAIDAKSLANQNRILNKSITPEVLELRRLQLQEKQIGMMKDTLSKGGSNAVFVPYDALGNNGLNNRMFNKQH